MVGADGGDDRFARAVTEKEKEVNYKERALVAVFKVLSDGGDHEEVVERLDEMRLLGDMDRVAADLEAIAARQARERTAWRDEWSVSEDYPEDYADEDPTCTFSEEEAKRIVRDYDHMVLIHRRVTDWRKVNFAESDAV